MTRAKVRRGELRSRSGRPAIEGKTPATASAAEVIAQACRELGRVESILGCVALAMLENSELQAGMPFYADVVEVAREFVIKTINVLDGVRPG